MGGAGIFQLAGGSPAEGRSFPELHMGWDQSQSPCNELQSYPGALCLPKAQPAAEGTAVSGTLGTAGAGRAMEKMIWHRAWVCVRVNVHGTKELVKQVQCLPCKGAGHKMLVFHSRSCVGGWQQVRELKLGEKPCVYIP